MGQNLYMISDMAKLAELRYKNKPIICEFYTDWCPPCKPTRTYIDKFNKQSGSKFSLAYINCDEAEELNIEYEIEGVPTVIVLRCDNELSVVDRLTGYDDQKLRQFFLKVKQQTLQLKE